MGMLHEGMIKIPPKEREKIKDFFRGLKKVADAAIKAPESNHWKVWEAMKDYARQWTGKFGKRKNLQIYIDWAKDRKFGEYDASMPWIVLNLRNFSTVRPLTKDAFKVESINFNKMVSIFYHELVHQYQDVLSMRHKGKRHSLNPGYADKESTYYSEPWEQQAWASQYVEELRLALKKTTPEQIFSHLKHSGFLNNPTLQKLKETDFNSWKKMMKNAVMWVVADMIGIPTTTHN
jgi:hypothetical protein